MLDGLGIIGFFHVRQSQAELASDEKGMHVVLAL